ncbi:MAG TPA: F0F1 ATP synthase subunit B [Candidatus Saccharibacteria bacterium]|jgi:F-type H+-transporting ATPase subunit b|nr:F0F1 ATP synthase subunit B [Candidatus Saccharibacteria bacterium]HMT55757.1 F0F1 ATP synthase subunit B [Candidatus Saccharibacteria bacterium]
MNYRIVAVVDATDTGVEHVAVTEENESDTSHTAEPTTTHEATTSTESGTHESTTEAGHAEGGESEGIAALGLSPVAIGAQLLTFLVLFIVVKKFALEGIVKNLQKRHDDINRGLHLTAELDKEKADLEVRVEQALKAARKEADAIIAEAHTETSKMIQAAEEKAGVKAQEIIKAAESKIERDIADARNGLKKEMASLITEATEAILNQKLDTNSDRKLVEDYLKGALK